MARIAGRSRVDLRTRNLVSGVVAPKSGARQRLQRPDDQGRGSIGLTAKPVDSAYSALTCRNARTVAVSPNCRTLYVSHYGVSVEVVKTATDAERGHPRVPSLELHSARWRARRAWPGNRVGPTWRHGVETDFRDSRNSSVTRRPIGVRSGQRVHSPADGCSRTARAAI
jgi:hypothetical protein